MEFTINDKPASYDEAQRHFVSEASKAPTPELIAMCPGGLPLTFGDLMYVWEGITTSITGMGWEAYRAEIEKTGVRRVDAA